MITIITPERSYVVRSINIVKKDAKSELWCEHLNGVSIKLVTADEQTIKEHKEAIDFCLKKSIPTYEIA